MAGWRQVQHRHRVEHALQPQQCCCAKYQAASAHAQSSTQRPGSGSRHRHAGDHDKAGARADDPDGECRQDCGEGGEFLHLEFSQVCKRRGARDVAAPGPVSRRPDIYAIRCSGALQTNPCLQMPPESARCICNHLYPVLAALLDRVHQLVGFGNHELHAGRRYRPTQCADA